MKRIFLLSLLFAAVTAVAQKPIVLKVWPNGAPESNGITAKETGMEHNRPVNITEALLYVFPAGNNATGQAILDCPGGGYTTLAMDHEGLDMAAWFNMQGITYAVLKYRMPNGHDKVPLSDAHEAIRILRKHAGEWHVRQLGIMGASAGGHLATTAATHYDADTRPDFQILFYPVVTMRAATHGGSRQNLLGKNPSEELLHKYSNEEQVTPQTPPAFIMHCSDDNVVPVANSVNYYTALVKNGVSATLHIYPTGGHGWGYNDGYLYKRQWTGELEKWLRVIRK